VRRLLLSPYFPFRLASLLLLLGGLLLQRQALAQAGAPSPTVRISGTVSAAGTREPIPGATVQVQRTRRGVAADIQGDFLVTALPTDTLLFRAVGFKSKRFALNNTTLSQLVVQIAMVRDSVKLSEVRITADRPPKPKPLFAVDSTAPKAEAPTISGSNVDWLYDQFSRQGKERRKVEALKANEAAEKAYEKRKQYNRAFKDNRGYE
jgi:hypothetical protein